MPKTKPTPRVRPPRAPKGEDPFVTIANLENHVSLLTQRCEDLVNARDRETECAVRYLAQHDLLAKEFRDMQSANTALRQAVHSAEVDISTLRGYQIRVREEDRHRYGDLTEVNITGGNRG